MSYTYNGTSKNNQQPYYHNSMPHPQTNYQTKQRPGSMYPQLAQNKPIPYQVNPVNYTQPPPTAPSAPSAPPSYIQNTSQHVNNLYYTSAPSAPTAAINPINPSHQPNQYQLPSQHVNNPPPYYPSAPSAPPVPSIAQPPQYQYQKPQPQYHQQYNIHKPPPPPSSYTKINTIQTQISSLNITPSAPPEESYHHKPTKNPVNTSSIPSINKPPPSYSSYTRFNTIQTIQTQLPSLNITPSAPPEPTANTNPVNTSLPSLPTYMDYQHSKLQSKLQRITTMYHLATQSLSIADDDDEKYNDNSQPFPDAKGTAPQHGNYNKQQAIKDGIILRKAMRGMGCNKRKIVNITGNRNQFERDMIKKEFMNVDTVLYKLKKDRNLLKDLKFELTGDLKKSVCALYMETGEYDARLVLDAIDNNMLSGVDEDLLIEIICTRTNKQIKLIKNAWNKVLRRYKSLEDEIKKETKGSFQLLMLSLIKGNRSINDKPNDIQVKKDANMLYEYLNNYSKSDCKTVFIDMFTQSSWCYLRAVAMEYNHISSKYTLDESIKKIFGKSSDSSKGMQVILSYCMEPYDYWANKLKKSMKGLMTDDSSLIRIIVTRCEIDMYQVKEIFDKKYGNGKTLRSWIEGDTSGQYRKLLLLLCGYRDDEYYSSHHTQLQSSMSKYNL